MNTISNNNIQTFDPDHKQMLVERKLLDYVDFDVPLKQLSNEDTNSMTMYGRPLSQIDYAGDVIQYFSQAFSHKIILSDTHLYGIDSDGWHDIGVYSEASFMQFLQAITAKHLKYSSAPLVTKQLTGLITIEKLQNNIIQFDDAYLNNGKLVKGFYNSSMPKFVINQSVLELYKKGSPTIDSVSAVDDLLKFVFTNNSRSPEAYEYLMDLCSSCLVNNPDIHQANGKMIRLYGPTAGNGKSTILNLIKSALGENVTYSTSLANLKGYSLPRVANSLLTIDPDSSAAYLNEEVSSNIKQLITSDSMSVRDIYKSFVQVTPTVVLLSASNDLPKSADKSNGLLRRMTFIRIDDQLDRDQSWFDQLHSKKASKYMFQLLFLRAIKIAKTNHLHKEWQDEKVKKLFEDDNNNVVEFAKTFKDDIIYHPVKEVYNAYTQWCDDNAEIAFKNTKFNSTIRTQLKVNNISVRVSLIESKIDTSSMIYSMPDMKSKTVIKAWWPENESSVDSNSSDNT